MQFPVNPPFKGGAEATSWYTSLLLAEHGHDVYLFQRGDTGPTHPNIHNIQFDAPTLFSHEHVLAGAITRFAKQQAIDVLINISWIASLPALEAAGYTPPMMHWLMLPPDSWYPFTQSLETFQPSHIYTLTQAHQNQYLSVNPRSLTLAQPFSPITYAHKWQPQQDYVVWAGRPEYEKGPHIALQAAIDAGIAIRMYFTQETEFYNTHIEPLIAKAPHQSEFHFEQDITYIMDSLLHAQALLMPNQQLTKDAKIWEEPGARIASEALLQGCPVIATPNGCLPEYIIEGKNGYLIDYHENFELPSRLAHTAYFDRKEIQDVARQKWSPEAIYTQLMEALTQTILESS